MKKEFTKLVVDWVKYERNLVQLEMLGFNLTPEHPMWIISDRYAQLISEKFDVSERHLREALEPVFINDDITEVSAYVSECAQELLENNDKSPQ